MGTHSNTLCPVMVDTVRDSPSELTIYDMAWTERAKVGGATDSERLGRVILQYYTRDVSIFIT